MKHLSKNYYIVAAVAVIILSGSFFVASVLGKNNKPPLQPITKADPIESAEEPNYPTETETSATEHQGKLHIPILMYHHVGIAPENADATHKGLTVSTAEFETQIAWLKNHGYTSVSLDQLYNHLKTNSGSWPTKAVVITFDDGYVDAFENAMPVLKEYGFVGSFAVITGFAGQTQGDNFYASWDQISNAKKQGMEIICHTQNHFDGTNPKFTTEYIYANLTGCQQDLKTHLGSSLPYLVYPYGHFTDPYVSQAQKAGFVLGLTVKGSSYLDPANLMRLPRVRINPNQTMEKFEEKINS